MTAPAFSAETVQYALPPSGDTSGVTDRQNINAILTSVTSRNFAIQFQPGVYWIDQTITCSISGCAIYGCGSDQVQSAPPSRNAGTMFVAAAAMTDLFRFTGSATVGGQALYECFLDGNGLATNVLTIDAANVQVQNCDIRRPATNGAAINVTALGASVWVSNVRTNGANQAGTTGILVGATDSTILGCKAVNSLYGVQYTTGASGAVMSACHHTPGQTIGACAIWINGHPSHIQINGNRIDNHALGSGIQITGDANMQAIMINDNLFAQSVITDNTFAAIGVDTSASNCLGLKVVGNIVRNISGTNRYASLLSSQTLAGAAATNPTRMSTQGTTVVGNTVHAPVLYGASSNPLASRGNCLTTDGTTFAMQTDI